MYTCIQTQRRLQPNVQLSWLVSTFPNPHLYPRLLTLCFPSDCEGFDGTTPVSRSAISAMLQRPPSLGRNYRNEFEVHLSDATRNVTLEWASTPTPAADGSEGNGTRRLRSHPPSASRDENVSPEHREIITKKLYPRLLYAFSDVICFVTTNSRYLVFHSFPASFESFRLCANTSNNSQKRPQHITHSL